MEQRTPIKVTEAIDRIMDNVKIGSTEMVGLSLSDQRFLAEDLIADHPIPFFDRSSYDGFAVRSEDTQEANANHPVTLKVIESIGAGELATQAIGSREAIRIMTGAQMPDGADTVVMLEDTQEIQKDKETWIQIEKPLNRAENMALRGEDTAKGTFLAKAGRQIAAGEMAMLATFGYHQVNVYKQPVVGIYTTGTELLPIDAPLEPGKIRNSNAYMLVSQIRGVGAIPKYLGILPDDFELCYQSVLQALEQVDYLITTGGAAVGDYDFVQSIVNKLDAKVLFNKVAMRPGSVTTVAKKGDKWFFGLSGNPAACFVGFELFARPVLRTFLGCNQAHLPRSKARLQIDIQSRNSFTRLMRAMIQIHGDQVQVSPVGLDKSSVVSALIEANGLLVVPAETKPCQGDMVEVIWFDRVGKSMV